MRIERTISTISWIPSDLLEGMGKMATRMKMAHHDPPPPDSLGPNVHDTLEQLQAADRIRFANELRAFIDVDEGGTIPGFGLPQPPTADFTATPVAGSWGRPPWVWGWGPSPFQRSASPIFGGHLSRRRRRCGSRRRREVGPELPCPGR